MSRRSFLASAAATGGLVAAPSLAWARPRVVVVGGGFAGATAARALMKADPRIEVTLVESNSTFTACPFSNLVIAGLRELQAQQFTAVPGGGVSPADATASFRAQEALFAQGWFNTITGEVFG